MSRHLISASTILSFLLMVLALPLFRSLHLEGAMACPFRALAGFSCPTCGYTRVYWMTLAGHPLQAACFQPFLVLIFLGSAAAAVAGAFSLFRGRELEFPRPVVMGFWGILLISWGWNIYRGI